MLASRADIIDFIENKPVMKKNAYDKIKKLNTGAVNTLAKLTSGALTKRVAQWQPWVPMSDEDKE